MRKSHTGKRSYLTTVLLNLLVSWVFPALAIALGPAPAVAKDNPARILVEVRLPRIPTQRGQRPQVLWSSDRNDSHARQLAAGFQRLRSGTYIKCRNGGQAIMLLPTRRIALPQSHWGYLPFLPPLEVAHLNAMLPGVFHRGGRTRIYTVVFSPHPNAVVHPKSFVFRWLPLPIGHTVNLRITPHGSDQILWEASNINGATGHYTSTEARNLLEQWRATNPANLRLHLRFEPQGEAPVGVDFELIPLDREKQLQADLSWWDQHGRGISRLLARASLLHEAGLLPEAAEAFALAAQADQQSETMRQRTADEYGMIGDEVSARRYETSRSGPT